MTPEEFFAALFSGSQGLLEIRTKNEETGKASQRFFPLPAGIKAAAEFAEARSGKEHVYFGVYPRATAQGKSEAVTQVQCLFADIDAKDFVGGEAEIQERINLLTKQGFEPTISVKSGGGGRHLYWLLKEPIHLDPADPSHRGQIRLALWAIGDALGIPQQANVVHDIARVLRVPGTENIKKHLDHAMCEVTFVNLANVYDKQVWVPLIEAHPRPEKFHNGREVEFARAPRRLENPETLLDGLHLSDKIRGLILSGHGVPAGQGHVQGAVTRSHIDMQVITALVRAGADPDRIYDIFANCPIGAKMREHGNPAYYLARTIGEAQAYLEAHKDERQQAPLPEPDIATLDAYLSAVLPSRYKTYLQGNDERKHLATLVELAKHRAPPGAIYQAAQIAAMGQGDARSEYAERIYRKAMFIAQQSRSQTASRPTPAARESRAAGMSR